MLNAQWMCGFATIGIFGSMWASTPTELRVFVGADAHARAACGDKVPLGYIRPVQAVLF